MSDNFVPITVERVVEGEEDPVSRMIRQSEERREREYQEAIARREREQRLAFPGVSERTRTILARHFTSRWEVARTPDATLLAKRNIGPHILADIRQHYPFDPAASALRDQLARVETLGRELAEATTTMLTMMQEAKEMGG